MMRAIYMTALKRGRADSESTTYNPGPYPFRIPVGLIRDAQLSSTPLTFLRSSLGLNGLLMKCWPLSMTPIPMITFSVYPDMNRVLRLGRAAFIISASSFP